MHLITRQDDAPAKLRPQGMILRAHAAELARELRHSVPPRLSRAGGTERSSEFGCVLMCGSPLCAGCPNGAQAARCPLEPRIVRAESPRAMHMNDTLPRAPSSRLTWRWEKCRMPEERQSVPDRQQSGRGPCLQAQLHLSPHQFRSASVDCRSRRILWARRSAPGAAAHCPGPCTYSLQPRAALHPRSPAAQARRSSPVVAVAASRA